MRKIELISPPGCRYDRDPDVVGETCDQVPQPAPVAPLLQCAKAAAPLPTDPAVWGEGTGGGCQGTGERSDVSDPQQPCRQIPTQEQYPGEL